MPCYNSNPIIQNVQYPQPCDCCQDSECAQQLDSKCVYYNGPALPCTEITTGDSVEEALQKIEEKVCEATGDYSTYNTYCLAPIATQQEFVESISEGYCNLLDDFETFVNITFVNYQISVTNQFNAIINPNITCAVAGVTNTDTIYQVLNKYCTAITTLDSYTDISGVDWDCIAPVSLPNNLEEGFEILVGEICNLYTIMPVLPVFNNLGSCLPSPGAADSLVDTINKIKTRLCQTPTFDINALTWGCLVKPSTTTTNLQAAFQTVLTTLNDYVQNKLTFSPDFTLTATNPMDPCAGKTLGLTVPIVNSDRLVAATPGDLLPGTLSDKVTAGTNITLDFLSVPGQMIINSSGGGGVDTYKVKGDSTDTAPDFLIDKLTGLINTTDGLFIQDSYDPGSQTVQLFPGIDWTVFINKMFDVIQIDAALYARFCELACGCQPCTTTTTTSTSTIVPPCYDCYAYTYGPALASCSITWEDCDTGAVQTAYVNVGDTYNVLCMRQGSGTGCGPWVQGFVCGSYGPGCTTTTTTTVPPVCTEYTAANITTTTNSSIGWTDCYGNIQIDVIGKIGDIIFPSTLQFCAIGGTISYDPDVVVLVDMGACTTTTTSTTTIPPGCGSCMTWEYDGPSIPLAGDTIFYYSCIDGALSSFSLINGSPTGTFCNCDTSGTPGTTNGTTLTPLASVCSIP